LTSKKYTWPNDGGLGGGRDEEEKIGTAKTDRSRISRRAYEGKPWERAITDEAEAKKWSSGNLGENHQRGTSQVFGIQSVVGQHQKKAKREKSEQIPQTKNLVTKKRGRVRRLYTRMAERKPSFRESKRKFGRESSHTTKTKKKAK